MSKYYKAEDVINTLADQYMFEATMDSPYASNDINDYLENAKLLFSDLPTIEVSEDCIYTYCSRCGMRVVVDAPSVAPQVPSEDAISREWLISFIDAGHLRNPNEKCYSENDVVELIKNAPSVIPTTEQSSMVGEWIISEPIESGFGTIFECSYCGEVDFQPTNYCHNCGARMKGADDE